MSETEPSPTAKVQRAWTQWMVVPPGPGGGIPVASRAAGIDICLERGWVPVRSDGKPLKIYNPRYLAYCRAHGTPDPEAMLALDRKRWPGGVMAGYLVWNTEQWGAWRKETGVRTPHLLEEHHRAFDAWLEAKYPPS